METNDASNIFINTTGQIVSAYFPAGVSHSSIFCRYEIVAGDDWEHLSGPLAGITQSSISRNTFGVYTFNMPLEFAFKSTNVYGWPQIVVSVLGVNIWGAETIVGYAHAHIPPDSADTTIKAPLLSPKYTGFWPMLVSNLTCRRPEIKSPRMLANASNKIKGLSMESYGEIRLQMQTIKKSPDCLFLVWG